MRKLMASLLFLCVWAACGIALQKYGIIEHPAYWSLYGAIAGQITIAIII
jgi:hypothetical protein